MTTNRRDDIIREAAHLFRTQGYAQTTVREIADAVNMQSGSLFYHFNTKEDILVEIMGEGIDNLIDKLNKALQHACTPKDRLLALLRVHLTAMLEDAPDAMGVYIHEWRNLGDDARQKLIAQRDAYELHIMRLLNEFAIAGLISGDIKLFRLFLLGALNWTSEWYNPKGNLTADDIAERFLKFIVRDN